MLTSSTLGATSSLGMTKCWRKEALTPRHIVVYPDKGDRLCDISTSDNQVQSKVPDAYRDMMHVQEDTVSNRCNKTAANYKAETVMKPIGQDGARQSANSRENGYRDRHDLRMDRTPSQLFENRRSEECTAVAGGDDSKIHRNADKVSSLTEV